jgi:hypothetical protein
VTKGLWPAGVPYLNDLRDRSARYIAGGLWRESTNIGEDFGKEELHVACGGKIRLRGMVFEFGVIVLHNVTKLFSCYFIRESQGVDLSTNACVPRRFDT